MQANHWNPRRGTSKCELINENNNLLVRIQFLESDLKQNNDNTTEYESLKTKITELEDQVAKRDKEVKDLRNNNLTIQENLEFTNKS